MARLFSEEVGSQLQIPEDEQRRYAGLLADFPGTNPQYLVLVDRSPHVQAILLYLKGIEGQFHWIGASPVSTGKPGRFDYFTTPLGVFEHTVANHDYRALGTKNEHGIRGYGRKGMRVYDLGWVWTAKGWGDGRESTMRLQMHSTDPDYLEPKLGTPQSKGCIRIHATLNTFLDRHGVLDADYRRAELEGARPWVLRDDWDPTPLAGRYVVVVDTQRTERPAWSPRPGTAGTR